MTGGERWSPETLGRAFRAMLERDRHLIDDPALVQWPAGEQLTNKSPIFGEFSSIEHFVDYVYRWYGLRAPRIPGINFDLAERSRVITAAVYQLFGIDKQKNASVEKPTRVDYYNAEDFFFQTAHTLPFRPTPGTVLDFGAGYGRQANLWATESRDMAYIAVDAVERSYCVQSLYLEAVARIARRPFHDFLEDGERLAILSNGLFHVPSWRLDLIPDASVDLVICCHVLPEIGRNAVEHVVGIFQRVLKPGGALFIRDHDLSHGGVLDFDVDEILTAGGFFLEYRPYLRDVIETWGVPRLWRKLDPEIPRRRVRPDDFEAWLRAGAVEWF